MDTQDTKALTKAAVAITLDNELDYNRMIIDLATTDPAHFIEIIGGDALALAHKLLKLDPALFTKLARKQIAFGLDCQAVVRLLTNRSAHQKSINQWPSIIAPIKQIRETTGFGLKEAKDVVELLIIELQKQGMYDPVPRNCATGPIDSNMRQVLDSLIAAI